MREQPQSKTLSEFSSAYEPSSYEADIYKKWEKSGNFTPKRAKGKKPFTIVMPPPNATGTLHLGHAMMLAIEDVMIRYHRMKGDPTLWLPGTDHAGIATQNKVERLLAEKGMTRFSLGRKMFLDEVTAFVEQSKNTIRNQIRKMGSSCDWTREAYTLDPSFNLPVRTMFKNMYDDGLIYRGYRMVNWCPRCQSTLADDEVKYKEVKTKFYYFKYGPIIIGTARPETKFLDKVIIVHPDDKRYKKYIGKHFTVEWINGPVEARVIADTSANIEFGTGAMTITPAHDFIDFDLAKKYKIEVVKIIDESGNLTSATGSYAGMNAHEAREKIVAQLAEKNLVDHIDENYLHNLSTCYRCDTPIEPLPSLQWFIDVNKKIPKRNKTIKQLSNEVVKTGKIKILPDRFNKIYFHWMNNLRDWCISRQIWFGHQIPVWYCAKCPDKPIVAVTDPTKCPNCKGTNMAQDPDTLDTWFSSGMWTFSTLGWPKKTPDLNYFHPTSVLETAYDIIFFWVARMIIMTTYALKEPPFKVVYFHGLVRTRTGEKMSKSKPETCIDPLDMINKYGADALRLSMVIGSGPGNDLRLYEEKIAGYRNFVNKMWNATRFILMNVTASDLKTPWSKRHIRSTADRWIMTRLQKLTDDVTKLIEAYNFSEAGTKIYDFLWSELCDWYIEFSKGEHKNPPVLLHVLRTTLKLLHPFVPFVTEVLWEKLGGKTMLIIEPWPKSDRTLRYPREEKQIEQLHQLIGDLRKIRAEYHIDPAKKIQVHLHAGGLAALCEEKREAIMRLGAIDALTIMKKGQEIPRALKIISGSMEAYIPLEHLFDIVKEKERIARERETLEKEEQQLKGRLGNAGFVKQAPAAVVAETKARYEEVVEAIKKLKSHATRLEKIA